MKIKQLLYITCLATVVTACSSDDAALPQGERVPIGLSYTTQPQTVSRAAAATNLNDGTIASGKQVKVSISKHLEDDYENFIYTTGDAGAMTLPSPAPYYPLDDTNVDILAFYPATAGTSFTVLADQTGDDNYTASDLMWAEPITNQSKTTGNVALEFTHKMAKLVVTARKGTAIKEVNSVTLMNVKPTVSFNQTDGSIGAASGDAIEVKMVKEENAASVTGAAVFPAQTISGQLLKIGVTMTNDETGFAYYSVNSKSFAANSVYTVDLTVSWPEVSATTAITTWGNGGTAAVTHSSQFLTFNVNGVEFKMVYVEGTDDNITMTWGNYNSSNSAAPNNVSVTVQGLSDYYMGQTEVTNALWNAVMGSKPGTWSAVGANDGQPNAGDTYPVAYVSWEQICKTNGFLDKLNAAVADQLPTGMKFVLPSEAQWQYAAIGGKYTNGYTYSGSNTINDVAWYGNGGAGTTSGKTTNAVATKPANELGLYDMTGNVWEWCQDWYNEKANNAVLPKDYVNTTTASSRVYRGGSWNVAAAYCTVSFRDCNAPSNRYCSIGFRLALQ